jgi:dihydroorotate dehydrogenase (fumarate)
MDTSTSYLGLRLPHPFVAGASPLSAHLDSARRLEDAGAAALVMHSLFEEQVTQAHTGRIRHLDPLAHEFAAVLAEFPAASEYPHAPHEYAEHIRRLKGALAIPVVASLNGTSAEGWLETASLLEQAGADALEVNYYEVVTDLSRSAESVESTLRQIAIELKRAVAIPVAVKVSPYFTAFGHVAQQLDRAGVDGIVMFNRFYQPDIDIRTMTAGPSLELSRSAELLLRLRWLAILFGRINASLIVTGGVETKDDAIKALLAGAQGVQVVSALLRHGPGFMMTLRDGLSRWMAWHEIESLESVRGRLSLSGIEDPSAFERANYIRSLHSWNH